MRPELALTFPLTQTGRDVTVKYPVMINPTTVVKPGYILRVLYILNRDSDGSTDLALAHRGSLEQSYARNAGGSGETQIPGELAHEIEGYRREVWGVPNNFVLAMAQYPTDQMHLIFSRTGKLKDLSDERFSFFDGLFVGAPNGKVTVIAVERQSKAEEAGLKAGDQIVSVGVYPTNDDLVTFANAYSAAKKDATDNEAESYAMTVRSPTGETRQANLALPVRIKDGLMNGFLDKH
ncbi:MAG: PDZ domain-containing protein [Verrucomicrobiota bacterium]